MLRGDFNPISNPPKENMPVIVRMGGCERLKEFGLSEWRELAECHELAFFEDGTFCEPGTGHDMFEEWRGDNVPIGWLPLINTNTTEPKG